MVQGTPLGDEVAACAGVSVEAGMGRRREPRQRGRRVDAEVQRAPARRNGRYGDDEVTPHSRPHEDVAGEQAAHTLGSAISQPSGADHSK